MDIQVSDTKKELILQTARELLAKQGFAKTTLDDIANVLGMKKSSLYYYYNNKESLLEDVIMHEGENYFLLMEQALNKTCSTMDILIEYEIAKFNYVKGTVKLQQVSTDVILEIKSKMVDRINIVRKKENEMVKKILDNGIKKKEIKKCDTERIAELILTISEALRHREFYLASFTINKTIDFTKAIDEMVFAIKLIMNGLLINQLDIKYLNHSEDN